MRILVTSTTLHPNADFADRFVKYCPKNVFKYDKANDQVTVDDPTLITEFNDQHLGRKLGKTGFRVMDMVTIKWKDSFHFKVEVRQRVLRHASYQHSLLVFVQSTGCMPSWQIVELALAQLEEKLVGTVCHCLCNCWLTTAGFHRRHAKLACSNWSSDSKWSILSSDGA